MKRVKWFNKSLYDNICYLCYVILLLRYYVTNTNHNNAFKDKKLDIVTFIHDDIPDSLQLLSVFSRSEKTLNNCKESTPERKSLLMKSSLEKE